MANGKSILEIQGIIIKSKQLCELGRMEEACAILENCLVEGDDNPLVLRSIARIKMAQHKPHEAVPLLKRALALIQEEKYIQLEKLKERRNQNTIFEQDKERCLSDSDISFIEEISHEVKAQRIYYEWDDTTSPVDEKILYHHESSKQSLAPFQHSNQEYISEESLSSKEIETISDDFSHDLSFQDELFGLDESDITEEFLELEALEDILPTNSANLTDFAYEHAWDEFEPIGVEYDDEITGTDIFNLPTDNRLTRLERARQVALELGIEYGWDEDGINVLTMIFFKHWWSATRRSMRRELEAGVTPDELILAEQVREIWREYPEFSEAHHRAFEISQRYFHLSWPNALSLIRSFGAYPDPAEIEKLLVDLYEHWRDKPSLIYAYSSFRHYIEYQIGRGRSTLKEPPNLSFESENYNSEEWEGGQTDSPDNEAELRKKLLALGVDLESLDIHRLDSCRKWDYLFLQNTEIENNTPNNKHIDGASKNINEFHIGDKVKIISGRFKNYEGEIIGINLNKQKLSVLISFSCQLKEVKVKFFLLNHI
jgi:hypothetical protein